MFGSKSEDLISLCHLRHSLTVLNRPPQYLPTCINKWNIRTVVISK